MPRYSQTNAFTLAELIIAISIFVGVVTIAAGIYVSSFRIDRKTAFQQQIVEDARFLLKKIAAEIQANTVDYEEYYNRVLLSGQYGENYGAYRALFYDPGQTAAGDPGVNPDDLGVFCNDGVTKWAPGDTCAVLGNTQDENTGQNPYIGNPACLDPDGQSAFHNTCAAPKAELNLQNELYLISDTGLSKKIFAREIIDRVNPADPGTDVGAVSMVEMSGSDTDNDLLPDTFVCRAGYACTAGASPNLIPNPQDFIYDNIITDTDHHQDFIPISPLRISVDSLQFYISPIESPFLAFAEEDPATQHVPYVTIFLTVSPNKAITGGETIEDFSITLQETVTTELLKTPPSPVLGQY